MEADLVSPVQDLRFGWRTLRRRPLFALMAVLTLGLGIGAATAIFSVVDGVLLRRLPYPDSGTLVSVWQAFPAWKEKDGLGGIWDRVQYTFQDYRELKSGAKLLQEAGVFAGWAKYTVTGKGTPERLSVGLASANLFQLLGVRPVLGRAFLPGEDSDTPGQAARVALLSHEFWQRRYGGEPSIVGNSISLNGDPYIIAGILPEGFRLQSAIVSDVIEGTADSGLRDLWLPLGQKGTDLFGEGNAFEVLARLAPGVTPGQARSEAQALLPENPNSGEREVRVALRQEVVTSGFATPLLLIQGAAAILLLIACSNVATLHLGEAALRRQELATRSALGAGKLRIARQLLTESVILGLLGSFLGVLLAWAGTHLLVALAPPIPRLEEVEMSVRVLLFGLAAGISTGLIFGLAPLPLAGRAVIGRVLSSANRASSNASRSMQGGAIALQLALTAVLLVAGGLLARSLINLAAVNPGFDPRHLATFQVEAIGRAYATQDDASAFFEKTVQALQAVPGVRSVGGSYGLPFPGGAPRNALSIDGREGLLTVRRRTVLPSYHATLGIPLLAGREFGDQDGAGHRKVLIVSESLARRHWPDESPLGATVHLWNDQWTVVGIAGDVRHTRLDMAGEPTIYIPFAQAPRRNLNLVVRTEGDASAMIPLLREAVWSVDKGMPITDAAAMSELISRSAEMDRYRMSLILLFGGASALLAIVGLFSVTARSVEQRRREIGIRLALGARRGELVGMLMRGSLVMGLAGTAAGLILAVWASRLLSHALFEVQPTDLFTYGGVAALLLPACLLVSYIPARMAARVLPANVLREE